MKSIYTNHLEEADSINNNAEKLIYLTSVLRSLLQLTVITSFELAKAQTPYDEIGLFELTNRFRKPVDGLPLQIFDQLVPSLRSYVGTTFLNGWFEPTKTINEPLSKQLIQWVQFRNKRPGHGVLDEETTHEWSIRTEKIIKDCLIVFNSLIPKINEDGTIQLPEELSNLKIQLPILRNNHAVVVMDISPRKGIWKLRGQLLSTNKADEFTENLPVDNVFANIGLKPTSKYDLVDFISNNKEYSFFHNIPVRQTDTFEGRVSEIQKLVEWVDDEDSRYCLVYGDGGYGKTTLVLEFCNLIMESEFDFERSPPEIISYYTAKKTQWTESGLIHFTSINPAMDECIRELMRCFDPTLDSEWYKSEGRKIIDKAVGVLKKNRYTRDDILLIIDNTETLADSSEEVRELGSFFKQVGKKIGRILITSRRREFIEATPVYVEGLTEKESVNLMQRLAKEYNAHSIIQAGEAKLRRVSTQLMRKPILLEALVKYISHTKTGIDAAISNVFKKSNEELLQFLYEDAWVRMNELQRKVFLTIIHITSPLDQNSIGETCKEIEIQHSEFHAALEETHFAILTDHGQNYTLELIDLARRFFAEEFSKLKDEEKDRLRLLAKNVDKYGKQREKIEREYKTDRVAEAFRSDYAKAAKVYADKGDINNAIEMYELAIEDDPVNSTLYDRFSWLLLNRTQKFEYAKEISKKAVSLDSNNCDAIVGLALAYYRLEDIPSGDKYIDKAKALGRSYSFCLLRKGIARYHQAIKISDLNISIKLLEEALEYLIAAEKKNTRFYGYDAKNLREITRYGDLTRKKLPIFRSKRTRASH